MVVSEIDLEKVPVCSLKMMLLQGRKKHYTYSSLRCTNLDGERECCPKPCTAVLDLPEVTHLVSSVKTSLFLLSFCFVLLFLFCFYQFFFFFRYYFPNSELQTNVGPFTLHFGPFFQWRDSTQHFCIL